MKTLKRMVYGAKYKLIIPDFKAITEALGPQSLPRKTNKTPEPTHLRQIEESKSAGLSGIASQRILQNPKPKKDLLSISQKNPKIELSTLKPEMFETKSSFILQTTQREFAKFQNPNLKSTREISKFDCWDEKKTPFE